MFEDDKLLITSRVDPDDDGCDEDDYGEESWP